MRWMHVDLNLLEAFDALLEEGSVSGAAVRLGITQPAMSRTLARLRQATGDAVLVRNGRSMAPSPRATAVRVEVRAIVRHARALLSPEKPLAPDRLERTFTVRCHDVLLLRLAGPLLDRLRREAPGVSVRFLAEGAVDDLRPGGIDLDIGSPMPSTSSWRTVFVAEDSFAVVVRSTHPCAKGRLTPARFAAAEHVVISRRGRLRDPLDGALDSLGLRRRVVASAPTTAAALQWVRDCNVIVVVAQRACRPQVESMGLVMRPLPLPTRPVRLMQSWPQHLDADPAHRWLRLLTLRILKGN